MSSTLIVKTAVRGYHVYQVLWQPRIRDSFIAVHEEGNKHHKYAMAVYRSEEPAFVVGHLPREIGKACYYFSKHNGQITDVVTGRRVYSDEAGGLEVPCRLTFTGHSKNVTKLEKIFQQFNSSTLTFVSDV